jgi:hypothetical protein
VTGRLAAAALAAAALLACPLPQPVNSYPNATAIPPPRILMDGQNGVAPAGTFVYVKADCPSPSAVFTLSAYIDDTNTAEAVGYRWFVDYAPAQPACDALPQWGVVQPPTTAATVRAIPPLAFDAYAYAHAAGDLHVVELVVSNGFVDPNDQAVPGWPCTWRMPQPNFETQFYRWLFTYVPQGDPNYGAALCGYPPPP